MARISIALCTWNGVPFLQEQLQSVLAQSRQPDELVACDDGSDDGTVETLELFARSAPFPVRLFANSARLGSTGNFDRAIGLCSGDVIALCDQDDVWLPEKLRRLEAVFDRRPEIGLTFTDAQVVDERGSPAPYRLWETVYLDRGKLALIRAGRAFEVMLRQPFVTGATMAFRAGLRDAVRPIPADWVHDGWIALLSAATAGVDFLEQPTILYRRHERQQIGTEKRNLLQRYRFARQFGRPWYEQEVRRWEEAQRRLGGLGARLLDQESLGRVAEKVAHCRARLAIRSRSLPGRLRPVLLELVRRRYQRYSPVGAASAAKDLFL